MCLPRRPRSLVLQLALAALLTRSAAPFASRATALRLSPRRSSLRPPLLAKVDQSFGLRSMLGLGKPEASEEATEKLLQAEEEAVEDMELPSGLLVAGGLGFLGVVAALGATVVTSIAAAQGLTLQEYVAAADVKDILEAAVKVIEDAGPMGYVYFAVAYTLAELVALPAVPLTASSGYLFGIFRGTTVVLISATLAASISFLLARTFLRQYIQGFAANNSRWRAIDKAVGREGFKLVLLLRLSPLLPFALSNYLYGLSAVDFWAYFWGTFFGFMPGTVAYVYSGQVGREIRTAVTTADEVAPGTPWYIYAGIFVALGTFIQIVSTIAKDAVAEIEAEEQVLAAKKEAKRKKKR